MAYRRAAFKGSAFQVSAGREFYVIICRPVICWSEYSIKIHAKIRANKLITG
jgi:hypothetical protein